MGRDFKGSTINGENGQWRQGIGALAEKRVGKPPYRERPEKGIKMIRRQKLQRL